MDIGFSVSFPNAGTIRSQRTGKLERAWGLSLPKLYDTMNSEASF